MSIAVLNDQALDNRLMQLEQARQWSARVISRLETMIRTADDWTLFRINPIQYAVEKSMVENEAIDLFLYGTKVGLFEIEWHLVCAFCGHIVASLRDLKNLHSHFVCDVCSVVNDIALDDYIQVAFTISPQVREISFHHPDSLSIEDYLLKYHWSRGASFPNGQKLEDFATVITRLCIYLEPKEKTRVELDLAPSIMATKDIINKTSLTFMVTGDTSTSSQTIPIKLIDGRFKAVDRTLIAMDIPSGEGLLKLDQVGQVESGKTLVEVENLSEKRCTAWVVVYPPDFQLYPLKFEPFLSGKRVLTTQTFRDLFRNEVIQTEEGISVRDITFMFTDLKGSTAMYDRIGDPKAYYLVRQHFDTLGRVIARHSGAVVKTIGDGVHATFMNPVDAVKAAIDMLEEIETFNRTISEKLILKIGIHSGHSIVVTLNDRIDYFGQTVNIASRVQWLADAGEIFVSSDAYQFSGVADVVARHDVSSQRVELKGVSEKFHVHKIAVRR